ncbi:MAG TPA: sulfatase [Candidatus Limnocylindria bacterium]|nr:sulfatase [Candidatus Limnocylindria bacterium]
MRAIGAGMAGGMLAAALVGAGEALALWLGAPTGSSELPPLTWALLAYGAVGAAAGLGAGLVAAVIGIDGFGLALAGIGLPLAFVVGRFRIVRDVFLEQMPTGTLALAVQVAALLACVAVGVWLWWRLRGADARGRLLTRPLGAAALVLVAAGVWNVTARTLTPAPPPPPAPVATLPAGAPHVLLIMVDTLRADHLGAFGSTRVKTPHIDRLAADGTRYTRAFAQASWTRPSVATILTGLYPSSHGAVHKADTLRDGVITLAEAMAAGGYRTVGFPNNVNVTASFNFQQGFGEFHYLAPSLFFGASEEAAKLSLYSMLRLVRERFLSRSINVYNYYQPAEAVTEVVTRWLDGLQPGERFFLYAHYMDPHDPYMVHPFNGEGYARVALPNPPPEMAERLREVYEGEVAYLDQHLGVLFDDLRRRGLYDQTLIVLTADHGEEFHEHGGWWHGTTLYDEQTNVPLVVKPAGGGARGAVVDELVTTLDIAPTVLTAAGLPVPPAMQGHALPLDGALPPRREVVFSEEDFEGNVLQALRSREWKLVTANAGNPRGLPEVGLYDLVRDPKELANAAATAASTVEEMRAALGRKVVEARAHAGATTQTDIDSVTRDRLKALGYLD